MKKDWTVRESPFDLSDVSQKYSQTKKKEYCRICEVAQIL